MIIVNRDFVLYNFRFELLEKLIEKKYEVYICLPYGPKVDKMTQIGARFIPLMIDGRGKSILKDIKLIKDLKSIIAEINPNLILLYTTKVDIYGGIMASKLKIPYILNISGLGSTTEGNCILRKLIVFLYRKSVKDASCVFFQNHNDYDFFNQNRIICKKKRMIPGSGVNITRWEYLDYPSEKEGIAFAFIARLIKEKGIEVFLEIAKYIKNKYPNTLFYIAGPDDGNYSHMINQYEKDGVVKYYGMVQDTKELLIKVHCVVNPSYYHEGVSNVCLEAASSGKPLITTDNPGCKETVEDGITGYIAKKNNTEDMIKCIERFLNLNWNEKRDMGVRGREKIQREFDRRVVTNSYIQEIDLLFKNEDDEL